MTDRQKAEKIIDEVLVNDALIVMNLDRGIVDKIKDWSNAQVEAHYNLREKAVNAVISIADAAYEKGVSEGVEKGQAEAQQEGIDAANAYSNGTISFEKWAERMNMNFYELASACRKYWQSLKESK